MKFLGETRSGSRNGETASRNRFGQYLRRHAVPVQPRSPRQREVRGAFTLGTQGWRLLSLGQQQAWGSWADNHPRVDKLGQKIILTGHQVYVGVVNLCRNMGQTIPSLPPTREVSAVVSLAPAPSSVEDSIVQASIGTEALSDLETGIQIQAARPTEGGRKFFGHYRDVVIVPDPLADNLYFVETAAIARVWGELPGVFRVMFRARVITGGLPGAWQSLLLTYPVIEAPED